MELEYPTAITVLKGVASQASSGALVLVARENTEPWQITDLRGGSVEPHTGIIEVLKQATASMAASASNMGIPSTPTLPDGGDDDDYDSDDEFPLFEIDPEHSEVLEAEVPEDKDGDKSDIMELLESVFGGGEGQGIGKNAPEVGNEGQDVGKVVSEEKDLISWDDVADMPPVGTESTLLHHPLFQDDKQSSGTRKATSTSKNTDKTDTRTLTLSELGDELLWTPRPTKELMESQGDEEDCDVGGEEKALFASLIRGNMDLVLSPRKGNTWNSFSALPNEGEEADVESAAEDDDDDDGSVLGEDDSLFTPKNSQSDYIDEGDEESNSMEQDWNPFTSVRSERENPQTPVRARVGLVTHVAPHVQIEQPAAIPASEDQPRRSSRFKSKQKVVVSTPDEEEDNIAYIGDEKEQLVYVLEARSPRRKVLRSSPTAPPSTLLSTAFLSLYDLKWNIPGSFIVCSNPECMTGVAFDQLWNHVGGHKLKARGLRQVPWLNSLLKDVQRVLQLDTLPVPVRTHHSDKGLDMAQWHATVRPTNGERIPFEGVCIHEGGFICLVPPCNTRAYAFCAPKYRTVETHWIRDCHDVDYRLVKPLTKRWTVGHVQTVLNTPGNQHYFQVNPPSSAPPVEKPIVTMADKAAAFKLQAAAMLGSSGALAEHSTKLLEPAFHTMQLPQLWETLDASDIRDLLSIKSIPVSKATAPTKKLYLAVLGVGMAVVASARKAHSGLLNLIINSSRMSTHNSRRPFTVPQRLATLAGYMGWEVLYLRRMLYVYMNPMTGKDGRPVFQFNSQQQQNLANLWEQLHEGMAPHSDIENSVVDTLHSLYFPKSPENAAFDVFSQPLAAYVALTCLTPDGLPIPLAHVPVLLTKVQFSMRLRAYHHVYTMFTIGQHQDTALNDPEPPPSSRSQGPGKPKVTVPKPRSGASREAGDKLPTLMPGASGEISKSRGSKGRKKAKRPKSKSKDDSGSDYTPENIPSSSITEDLANLRFSHSQNHTVDQAAWRRIREGNIDLSVESEPAQWYKAIRQFLLRHMSETDVSVYATLRGWMHHASVGQRNAKKFPFIQWRGDNELLYNNDTLAIPLLKDFINQQLDNLEKLVRDHILLGATLDSLGINHNITEFEDSGDVLTIGYGPLLSDERPLNPDCIKLMLHLEEKRLFSQEGALKWDAPRANVWNEMISVGVMRLLVLCHILQGAPGRGTEEMIMQLSNSSAGRRHLFVDRVNGTFVTFSNYWKGASTTGRFKEVLRVLPYRLSRLLLILIRLVRPIQLLFLGISMDANNLQIATDAYFTRLWANNGKALDDDFLAKAILSFFTVPVDGTYPLAWISGIRKWRHIVVALQRRMFPDSRFTKETAQKGTSMADRTANEQAGRSMNTSNQYYATTGAAIPADAGLIGHYTTFSAQWHSFFDLATSFEPQRTYTV